MPQCALRQRGTARCIATCGDPWNATALPARCASPPDPRGQPLPAARGASYWRRRVARQSTAGIGAAGGNPALARRRPGFGSARSRPARGRTQPRPAGTGPLCRAHRHALAGHLPPCPSGRTRPAGRARRRLPAGGAGQGRQRAGAGVRRGRWIDPVRAALSPAGRRACQPARSSVGRRTAGAAADPPPRGRMGRRPRRPGRDGLLRRWPRGRQPGHAPRRARVSAGRRRRHARRASRLRAAGVPGDRHGCARASGLAPETARGSTRRGGGEGLLAAEPRRRGHAAGLPPARAGRRGRAGREHLAVRSRAARRRHRARDPSLRARRARLRRAPGRWHAGAVATLALAWIDAHAPAPAPAPAPQD